jgi:methionine aminopeptidase
MTTEHGYVVCTVRSQANNAREFARKHGYGINTQFSGHGIGQRFHQEPWILHHRAYQLAEVP